MEIRDVGLERSVRKAINEMNGDPRMIGMALEDETPEVAIERIAAATRGTLEAVNRWARAECEFTGPADETDLDRNNRVARNIAILKAAGEWTDRSVRTAEIQAKLGISQLKANMAVSEHLSLARMQELRELSSREDVSDAMATLAARLRPVIEGEAIEDDD
jgi:hypothetical protein